MNQVQRLPLWPIVTIFAGLILGWGLWQGKLQQYSDAPPPKWQRENSPVPYRESALQGSLSPAFGDWGLDFYRAIYPTEPTKVKSLSVIAKVPEEGLLEIWYSAPPIRKEWGTDGWIFAA